MARALLVTSILLAATVLAGCQGPSTDLTTPPTTPPVRGDEVVHNATGAILDEASPVMMTPRLFDVGGHAFEPTLGLDPAGAIYYAMASPQTGLAVGYGPEIHRSTDGGRNWTAVGPRTPTGQSVPPETNDPFIYVDPGTGRVFQFAMAPILLCSILSWSDDQGATWTTNPRGCGNPPPWDHQSMVAAKPRLPVPTTGYPNVLIQCVNQVAGAFCSTSRDGGLTWTAGTQAYTAQPFLTEINNCSGSSVHGHPVADLEGRVYLPTSMCGTAAVVAVTEDDGATWTTVQVTDVVPANMDPAMAVDAAGTAYFAFADDKGVLWLSSSKDQGRTWSPLVRATPEGMTANIPALAAGDAGRLVLAYPGTFDIPEGFGGKGEDKAAWNGYLTVTLGGAELANATFSTVQVNPEGDPFVRGACGPGRCPGFVDFMAVRVGPDGRPYAAFIDACTGDCADDGKDAGDNNDQAAFLATLDEAFLGRHFAYPAGNATAGR